MFMGKLRNRVGDWQTSGVIVIAALTLVLGWSLNWWLHPRVVERTVYQWSDKFEPKLGESYQVETCRMVEVVDSSLSTDEQDGVLIELNVPQTNDVLMRWYPRKIYPYKDVIWVNQLPANTAVFVQAGDGTVKLLLSAPRPDTRLPDRTIAQFCSIAK